MNKLFAVILVHRYCKNPIHVYYNRVKIIIKYYFIGPELFYQNCIEYSGILTLGGF